MLILGISAYYHDSAAALLKDGQLVAVAEEERFSRKKHDFGFPHHAIRFCLERGGIRAGDLDYVVFYEKPFAKFERILMSSFQTFPRSLGVFRESMTGWLLDKLWIKNTIKTALAIPAEKILFSEHHLSHAASSFFCSPFDEAAILAADAVGEWTTTSMGIGKGNKIALTKELRFPHSLGLFYSAFTAFLGFEVNEGEYKVMGMAPYGQPRYLDKVLQLVDLHEDGSFALDMNYFCYHHSKDRMFNGRFADLFGRPRRPEESHILDPYYNDIAASIQVAVEEILLKMARHLQRETGLARLCMAGGVALNSVANGRILRETPFEEIYISPAAGDGGGALGAALFAYHHLLGKPRSFVMEHAYWGQEYGEESIEQFLRGAGIRYKRFQDDDALLDRVVGCLQGGEVVGWYQGRFEYGPRALGNRSILADPRRADMKDIVNHKIKFREPFRPFAPSVLVEKTGDWFDLPEPERHYPARFMLYVVDVNEEARDRLPATTHVGGTSRVQTVDAATNPRYYRLIQRFGEATGVPVVLNTSFNLRGEPIVTTPENAYNTFQRSEMDTLVMGPYLLRKSWDDQA